MFKSVEVWRQLASLQRLLCATGAISQKNAICRDWHGQPRVALRSVPPCTSLCTVWGPACGF
jgi:hypothetical protein